MYNCFAKISRNWWSLGQKIIPPNKNIIFSLTRFDFTRLTFSYHPYATIISTHPTHEIKKNDHLSCVLWKERGKGLQQIAFNSATGYNLVVGHNLLGILQLLVTSESITGNLSTSTTWKAISVISILRNAWDRKTQHHLKL
jgi:hypothetical protein